MGWICRHAQSWSQTWLTARPVCRRHLAACSSPQTAGPHLADHVHVQLAQGGHGMEAQTESQRRVTLPQLARLAPRHGLLRGRSAGRLRGPVSGEW